MSAPAHRTLDREAGLWGEWARVGGGCFLRGSRLAGAILGAVRSVTVNAVLYGARRAQLPSWAPPLP